MDLDERYEGKSCEIGCTIQICCSRSVCVCVCVCVLWMHDDVVQGFRSAHHCPIRSHPEHRKLEKSKSIMLPS